MSYTFCIIGEINKHVNSIKKSRLGEVGERRGMLNKNEGGKWMLSTRRWHLGKDIKERKDELNGSQKEDIPAEQTTNANVCHEKVL